LECANLVEQADAPAFLTQIQQRAAAFFGNGRQSCLQLKAAITAQAEQRITGKAFRMQAAQHRFAVSDVAHGQYDMLLAGLLIEKAMHGEHAKRRRQLGSSDEHDRHRRNSRSEKETL